MLNDFKEAKSTLDCLRQRRDRFRRQIEAVLNDWNSLTPMNEKNLVVGLDFRPLPAEIDIVSTIIEIKKLEETVSLLGSKLGLPT